MAFTREPSFKRASTSGTDSSIRRPSGDTIRLITCTTCSLLRNLYLVSVSLPFCSIKILSNALTIISVTLASRIKFSSGPKPKISSSSSELKRVRCSRENCKLGCFCKISSTMAATRLRVCSLAELSSLMTMRSISNVRTTSLCTFCFKSSQKDNLVLLASPPLSAPSGAKWDSAAWVSPPLNNTGLQISLAAWVNSSSETSAVQSLGAGCKSRIWAKIKRKPLIHSLCGLTIISTSRRLEEAIMPSSHGKNTSILRPSKDWYTRSISS